MTLANPKPVIGLIDSADGGKDHQLRFEIEQNAGGYVFVIRSQHRPGGAIGRRCTLDSGSTNPNYDEVLSAGRAAFEKAKEPIGASSVAAAKSTQVGPEAQC